MYLTAVVGLVVVTSTDPHNSPFHCSKTEHRLIAILHLDLSANVSTDVLLALGPVCMPDSAKNYDLEDSTQTFFRCQEEYGLNTITGCMICTGDVELSSGHSCQRKRLV